MLQAALPVEAVIAIDGSSSGFWPGKTNIFFKYSIRTLIKYVLPTPAPPVRNIWNGSGSTS